jgi:hypothetical protein
MRRIVIAAVATLSLAAPSAALAHHHGERHHRRGHHHGQAHVLAFHAQTPAGSTTSRGTPSTNTTPASEESAGTIASFENGVLTIKLNDGSTVSGKVTEQTEIECPAPTGSSSPGPSGYGERRYGGDGRFDDQGQNEGSWQQGGPGDDHAGCPGHQASGQQNEPCTTAALVPNANVKEAFLGVGGQGATWLKVGL